MKSSIVEVVVGSGADRTTYSAHEAVLVKSPEFAKQMEQFAPGGVSCERSLSSLICTQNVIRRLARS